MKPADYTPPKMEGKQLVLIQDFILLNRKGLPCSNQYKWRLIKNFEKGISGHPPFEYMKDNYHTYVILDAD